MNGGNFSDCEKGEVEGNFYAKQYSFRRHRQAFIIRYELLLKLLKKKKVFF